jgi:hypothetical protein
MRAFREHGATMQGYVMAGPAEDVIVHNLLEALDQLRRDLDRVEMWTAALGSFQTPVPDYQPANQYLLRPVRQREAPRPRS